MISLFIISILVYRSASPPPLRCRACEIRNKKINIEKSGVLKNILVTNLASLINVS